METNAKQRNGYFWSGETSRRARVRERVYLPPGVVGGCVVPLAAPSTPVPDNAAFCFSIVQSKV